MSHAKYKLQHNAISIMEVISSAWQILVVGSDRPKVGLTIGRTFGRRYLITETGTGTESGFA